MTELRRPRPGDVWVVVAARDGVIVDAAPYGRRYVGLPTDEVARQLRAAGATFTRLPDLVAPQGSNP